METPKNSTEDNTKLMSILAYLGPLVIISYATAKDNPHVKFHIKQGLVVFVIEVGIWFVSSMFWQFWMILNFANFGVLILSVLGIINVVNGKEEELPIVGQFASHFKI